MKLKSLFEEFKFWKFWYKIFIIWEIYDFNDMIFDYIMNYSNINLRNYAIKNIIERYILKLKIINNNHYKNLKINKFEIYFMFLSKFYHEEYSILITWNIINIIKYDSIISNINQNDWIFILNNFQFIIKVFNLFNFLFNK